MNTPFLQRIPLQPPQGSGIVTREENFLPRLFAQALAETLKYVLGEAPTMAGFGPPASRMATEEVRFVIHIPDLDGEVVVGLDLDTALEIKSRLLNLPPHDGLDEIDRDALSQVFRHMAVRAQDKLAALGLQIEFNLQDGLEVLQPRRLMGHDTGKITVKAPGCGKIHLYHRFLRTALVETGTPESGLNLSALKYPHEQTANLLTGHTI